MNDSPRDPHSIERDHIRIVRTSDQIALDNERMGNDLRRLARGRCPIFIGILKGSVVFLADLIRSYRDPHQVDFLSMTRYDPKRRDPQSVRVLHDLATNITGRLVFVVEGVRTRGTKVTYLDRFLRLRGAEEVRYCAMVRQKGSRTGAVALDSWGFETDDEQYVVGYGLDLQERFRNLPYIGVTPDPVDTSRFG